MSNEAKTGNQCCSQNEVTDFKAMVECHDVLQHENHYFKLGDGIQAVKADFYFYLFTDVTLPDVKCL